MKYVFKKGRHFAWHFFKFYFKNSGTIEHRVKFSKNCLYSFGTIDDFDVNKLFGRSFGYHHTNSIRFGWRSDGKNIIIYAYNYKDGVRHIKELCKCIVNKEYTFKMKYSPKDVLLEISSKDWTTKYAMDINAKRKFGYKLYPYFGGNRTAPHEMIVELF